MLLLIVNWISGCQNSTAINACLVFSEIKPSRHDILTEGTKQQILKYDETRKKLCK